MPIFNTNCFLKKKKVRHLYHTVHTIIVCSLLLNTNMQPNVHIKSSLMRLKTKLEHRAKNYGNKSYEVIVYAQKHRMALFFSA